MNIYLKLKIGYYDKFNKFRQKKASALTEAFQHLWKMPEERLELSQDLTPTGSLVLRVYQFHHPGFHFALFSKAR